MILLAAGWAWAADIRVDMLDVGQGDAILVRTPADKSVLIDAGDGRTDVVAALRALGVDHLDLVIATHPHADHVGGMQAVVEALPPRIYVDNGLPHTTQTYQKLMAAIEANPAIQWRAGLRDTRFNLDDGASLTLLFPESTPLRDTRSDLNSNSVVARLDHGTDCFLFVGDAEEPTEDRLVDGGLAPCGVLKVAHHGSRHSSTPSFLDAVKPQIALISVGAQNRYHHPGQETLDELRSRDIQVHRTDLEGRITVVSTGHGVRVETERAAEPAAIWVGASRDDGPIASTLGRPEGVRQDRAPGQPMRPELPVRPADPSPGPATAPTGAAPSAVASPVDGTDPATDCAFLASKKSEVFHEATCGNGLKISAQNLVCYPTREAAVADGRRPAGCCHP